MALGLLEQPNRGNAASDLAKLVTLEDDGSRPTVEPTTLGLNQINVATSLFQPRDTSLQLAPRHSQNHVATMKRVVEGGSDLDPVVVMSFGPDWYVIDGHHRLESYRQGNPKAQIPIEVYKSEASGKERVQEAIQKSTSLNSKNKLDLP